MESTLLESFHFIRPLWLLMLIPLVSLLLLGQQRRKQQRQWHQVIDPQLIDHMVEQAPSGQHMPQLRWLAIGGLLAIFAAAGPSWQKLPQPVYKNDDSLVVLLDMSYSMAAEDVKPSRAERAIQKVHDILNTRRDGLTALVTYAGDAHTVTPLTDDNATIANLLPALSPFIMPKAGSRPDLAIQLAQHLVRDAGQKGAQLLLITDGIQDRDIGRIESALDTPDFQLGIITLGSKEGAPIPLPKGGFLQDGNGAMVLPGLNTAPFSQLRQQTGIQWQPISLLDNDWQSLIRQQPVNAEAADSDGIQRQYDSWIDEGYWLLLPLLPLALLVFRKGTFAVCVMAAVLLSSAIPAQPAYAEEAGQVATAPAESSVWDNLWSTPDQQGSQLIATDPAAAAQRFEDSSWAGSAAYKAGDYQAAADAFAKALEQNPTAEGYYNQANALAQQGKLQQALDAYDQALAQNPHMEDAIGNRKIVEQALKQQQQQNQNQSQDSSDNSSQDASQGDEQNQQDQGQQQNSQNQQGSNKQDQGQQQSQSNQQGQQQGQSSDQANDQQGQSGNSDRSEQQNDKDFQQRLQQQQNQQAQQNQQRPSDAEAGQQQSTEQRQEQGQDPGQQDQTQAESGEQGDDQTPQNVQPLGDIPADSLKNLSPEQQANLRQWLNRVPDQPGKLLQRKFLYQYSQQQQQENDPEEVLW